MYKTKAGFETYSKACAINKSNEVDISSVSPWTSSISWVPIEWYGIHNTRTINTDIQSSIRSYMLLKRSIYITCNTNDPQDLYTLSSNHTYFREFYLHRNTWKHKTSKKNSLELVTSHSMNWADWKPNLGWNLELAFEIRDDTSFPFSSEKSTTVTNIPISPRAKLRAFPTYYQISINYIISKKYQSILHDSQRTTNHEFKDCECLYNLHKRMEFEFKLKLEVQFTLLA